MKYFDDWRRSIKTREGTFTLVEREMYLSQTYEGFKISVHSHVKAIKFLLSEGFKYVLSEHFMQDVIEDYFGHQRTQRGRSENPSAEQFGYNDLTQRRLEARAGMQCTSHILSISCDVR